MAISKPQLLKKKRKITLPSLLDEYNHHTPDQHPDAAHSKRRTIDVTESSVHASSLDGTAEAAPTEQYADAERFHAQRHPVVQKGSWQRNENFRGRIKNKKRPPSLAPCCGSPRQRASIIGDRITVDTEEGLTPRWGGVAWRGVVFPGAAAG